MKLILDVERDPDTGVVLVRLLFETGTVLSHYVVGPASTMTWAFAQPVIVDNVSVAGQFMITTPPAPDALTRVAEKKLEEP